MVVVVVAVNRQPSHGPADRLLVVAALQQQPHKWRPRRATLLLALVK